MPSCALPGGAAAAAAAVGAPSAPPPNAEKALELRRALADAAMDTAYMGIDTRRRLPQAEAAHSACAAVATISASRVYSIKPGAAKSVPPDTKVPWASLTGAAEELKKR